jgi:hypothetical protein
MCSSRRHDEVDLGGDRFVTMMLGQGQQQSCGGRELSHIVGMRAAHLAGLAASPNRHVSQRQC